MNRKFIAAVTGVLLIALSAVAVLKGHHVPAAIDSFAGDHQQDTESLFATRSASAQEHASPTEERHGEALQARVEHKYRYLFAEVDRAYVDELKRRLLQRESESASAPQRAQVDGSINELLPARELAYYQALKDSDLEQHHLTEYTSGISNVAPLDDHQQRLVLEAKLRQKQRYATLIRDIGLDRDSLSPEERQYAHAHAEEALKKYLDDFLQDISPSLTPEQYRLLQSYETTEFNRELARLQQLINAK